MAIEGLFIITKTVELDTLLVDTISEGVNDVMTHGSEAWEDKIPWMWIAFIEAIVIITLVFFLGRNRKPLSEKDKIIRNAKNGEVDFDNIIGSSFNARSLYDSLKVVCHPDRFTTDPVKNEIALRLFQEISKNKTDLKKLTELKQEAIQKLNVKP